MSGPIGSSNICARSAGSGGGATSGAGSATGGAAGGTAGAPNGGGTGVAVLPNAGPDASEEEEERQEYAEVVTLAEEEPVRLASPWLRHRPANTAHGTPTAALGSPVSACPGLTMSCSTATVSFGMRYPLLGHRRRRSWCRMVLSVGSIPRAGCAGRWAGRQRGEPRFR